MRDRIQEFDQRGVKILTIAPDTVENARAYFEKNDLPFLAVADPDRKVFRQYDVKSAMVSLGQRPGLFIIDKDGVVRYAYLGWQQWEIPSINDTLKQLDALG